MEELFDKLKVHANKVKDEAARLTKTVIGKTNTAISQTKIKFAIGEVESKIKDIYGDIGKAVYENCESDTDISEIVMEKCGKIDALNQELAELKEQLFELKENVKCSECGAFNSTENVYCAKCGEKIRKDVTDDVTDEDFDDSEKVVTINPTEE